MEKSSIENHPAWDTLEPYRSKIKRGKTNFKNKYYYGQDYTHGDTEVYEKKGGRGIHYGCCPKEGGPLTKPPVKGRDISL